MHDQGHNHSAGHRQDSLDAAELQELLNRLSPVETAPSDLVPDDDATVAAVCEATGESEDRVWELLTAIRQEDMEARLAERLREAEEPLYRVERPGFQSDPLARASFFRRTKAFDSELDNLGKRKKSQKGHKPTGHEITANLAATVILILLLLAFVFIAVLGITQRL